jgi:hypothetical protein
VTRVVLLTALVAGCAAPAARLRADATTLSGAWRSAHVDGALAFHHPGGGAIAASWSCDVVDEDAPLDVLVNHELMQLEHPTEHGRESFVLDGRGALRAIVDARVDGVPVRITLVVWKKDGCVADAQLVGAANIVPARRADFDRFVASLSLERRR